MEPTIGGQNIALFVVEMLDIVHNRIFRGSYRDNLLHMLSKKEGKFKKLEFVCLVCCFPAKMEYRTKNLHVYLILAKKTVQINLKMNLPIWNFWLLLIYSWHPRGPQRRNSSRDNHVFLKFLKFGAPLRFFFKFLSMAAKIISLHYYQKVGSCIYSFKYCVGGQNFDLTCLCDAVCDQQRPLWLLVTEKNRLKLSHVLQPQSIFVGQCVNLWI